MIKIICVGKIKEKYLRDAIEEYVKRLSKYTKLEIIECDDYTSTEVNTILEKEKISIEKYIGEKDYLITLDIEGSELNSIDLSKKIDAIFVNYANIVFVIGGSYGIHNDIKKRSNYSLSFSDLTFPHQLFRIMLLEQIYRSYRIINNESYHK
jgi:Uncharacterized conserved protein